MKKHIFKILFALIGLLFCTVQYFAIRTINNFDNDILDISKDYEELKDKIDENTEKTNEKIDKVLSKMGEHSTSIEVINTKLSFFEEDMKIIYKSYDEVKNEKRYIQR